MWSLRNKPPEELTAAERNVLSWAALMDFGFESGLRILPQLHPGPDPLEGLRRHYARMSELHIAGNERMLRRLHGQ